MPNPALQRMSMKAQVRRTNLPADGHVYGVTAQPEHVVVPDLQCYVWVRQTEAVLDESRIAYITTYRAIVPLLSDVRKDDFVVLSPDKAPVVLAETRLRVTAEPQVRRTHKELTLEAVS